MKKFFDNPMQVSFRADDETMKEEGRKCWFGIAYHDYIICGCCGEVFKVEECEQITEYDDSWFDLEEAIGGDDYYDSLKE